MNTGKSKHHIFCSVETAAFNIGVTKQALYKWLKTHNIPKEGRNVDFTEILFLRKEQAEDISDTQRKLQAEIRIKTEKAKQEEIRTKQMMGEMLPIDLVETELTTLFTDIRQELLTIPNNVTTRIYTIEPSIAEECQEVTKEVIEEALSRLASGTLPGQKNPPAQSS